MQDKCYANEPCGILQGRPLVETATPLAPTSSSGKYLVVYDRLCVLIYESECVYSLVNQLIKRLSLEAAGQSDDDAIQSFP